MKVIVVGCTHAGTSAVKTILKENPGMEVTVYERNDNVSFLSCGIALYVGGVVKDPQGLFYSNPEELASLGANVNMQHDVTNIDTAAKTVAVKNLVTGEEFEDTYDKLVLTTGSWPIIPPIEGIQSKNVLLCKNYNQAKAIIACKDDKKKIVVIGGGYIGIELVEAFANDGKEVTLVDGLDRILNKYLDPEFTDVLEDDLRKHGVKIQLNEMVKGFKENEAGDRTTVITTGGEYEAELVILCVGFRPSTELVKGQVDMLGNGAIIVDDYMQTSVPDVFAAGDSCAVNYNPNGGHAYIPLATNAVRMGLLVGKNINGPKMKYRGTQSTSGLYLNGFNIGSTGVNDASAAAFGLETRSVTMEDNYRPEFMPTTEKVLMKLVYEVGTTRIVGGQIMSKYDVTQSANTLSLAIQNKMTIEDLALVDFFFQPHFDRPWNYLNLLAQKALDQEAELAKK
ncbi:pyridine nucleotide disulphide reductase class-i signature [Trichococcus palustris]|jgi:NADPH-dependent 2,4-dienoyl-CoA reductase/sulfur reductase-like enzyme|uniref:Pyridine nucleotide disulphide reductase class-i signature n=1 Tax=Trichococcus palustris TaxID=140314 RepID=A0A143YLV9_9LACT|nr:FAD-dependent oxidoreductase [Trichococcus palustris]CZQ91532.1 pyridine nucleotide disulphide reductase class-i signature [Trichococcus palustris]SFL03673.1 NADPH-dependent 2,4-dienoyl-CoA reductase, sulfur reductase [Trichococcus palustris]